MLFLAEMVTAFLPFGGDRFGRRLRYWFIHNCNF